MRNANTYKSTENVSERKCEGEKNIPDVNGIAEGKDRKTEFTERKEW